MGVQMVKTNKKIMEGAGPFYFKGNKIGVLMIHGGGGGTCADLKPLAEALHQSKGCTVHIPLLPGFGTTPEDLRNTPVSAWETTLNDEIRDLKKKCEKLIVGGHSMGGIFTLILASREKLDGIFTISAPIGVKGFAIRLIPFIRLFKKYYSVDSITLKEQTKGKWVGYDEIPLNMLPKVKKLMKEMEKSLLKITCPIIMFQGRLDSVIKKESMNYIFESVSSKIKRKIWLENNDHPILDSPDHEQIVLELEKFISEICP